MSESRRESEASVLAAHRARMVERQLVPRGVTDSRVLDVLRRIERHRFVPGVPPHVAYGDFPVSIGSGQTLSQPYVVALMTEALDLEGSERVLEVGTGSGYQTAVLAELVGEVFTVECLDELAKTAEKRLRAMGYENVHFRRGDGRLGWPEQAPFDAVLVTAAPKRVPAELLGQVGPRGRLVIPVGTTNYQELELYQRDETAPDGFRVRNLGPVRFVPLV